MKAKTWITLLKYVLGLGLLTWVVWQNWSITQDGEEVGLKAALEKPIHWGPFTLALLVCLAGILITFVRWYVLVAAQGLPFPLASALRLGLIGYYLSTFLPGSVGGDIIKAAFLAREQSRRTVAVATVVIDRVVGLVGLFWLATLLGGFFWSIGSWSQLVHQGDDAASALQALETILVGLAALSGGSLLFWLGLRVLPAAWAERLTARLERVPRIGGSLAELWRAVWMYRCRGRHLALAMLLAMLGHVGFILTFYWSACTLTPAADLPPLRSHFLLTPVGMTIQAGFPAPGGIGGGEIGFGWLYKLVGYSFAAGVLGSLVRRVIDWILALLGFLVYLRMRSSLAVLGEEQKPLTEVRK